MNNNEENTMDETGADIENPIVDKLKAMGLEPEMIGLLLGEYEELRAAIIDIPPQIELLARATVASKFIHLDSAGNTTFKRSAFEQVWEAIAMTETPQAQ